MAKLDVEIQFTEQELYGHSTHALTLVSRTNNKQHEPDFYMDQYWQIMPPEFHPIISEEQYYQMDFTVERIRVPETLFEPSILGLGNAGITEMIEMVLKQFNTRLQDELAMVRTVVTVVTLTFYFALIQTERLCLRGQHLLSRI